MKHQGALITIAAAALLDVVAGIVFALAEHIATASGLYWAVTTATTVGYGDVIPHNSSGRIIAIVVMLTVIPLFGATFSLFTSGLTGAHVRLSERALKAHIEERLNEHHKKLADHISSVVGGGSDA